ncbi:MAG: hypothetical protein JRM82_04910, partial [Nitrososphaerota archaeon]|nr:hypothetical protein [Nitrososphaerota archaeon]
MLAVLYPQVPILIPFLAVGFPDLAWALLILSKVEKVKVNPDSPLQKDLVFEKYPYSHSLVLTNALALAFGLALTVVAGNASIAVVFVLGSASHWALDVVVHNKDLPILGFNGDRTMGFGLWRWGRTAFVVEFVFYVTSVVLLAPPSMELGVLLLGGVFHLFNANSFLGFTKTNPFGSPS